MCAYPFSSGTIVLLFQNKRINKRKNNHAKFFCIDGNVFGSGVLQYWHYFC